MGCFRMLCVPTMTGEAFPLPIFTRSQRQAISSNLTTIFLLCHPFLASSDSGFCSFWRLNILPKTWCASKANFKLDPQDNKRKDREDKTDPHAMQKRHSMRERESTKRLSKEIQMDGEKQARIQDFGQGGPSGVLTPLGGPWAQYFLKTGVFLKIAWKLHDFEEILGQGGPGPPGPPGSATENENEQWRDREWEDRTTNWAAKETIKRKLHEDNSSLPLAAQSGDTQGDFVCGCKLVSWTWRALLGRTKALSTKQRRISGRDEDVYRNKGAYQRRGYVWVSVFSFHTTAKGSFSNLLRNKIYPFCDFRWTSPRTKYLPSCPDALICSHAANSNSRKLGNEKKNEIQFFSIKDIHCWPVLTFL